MRGVSYLIKQEGTTANLYMYGDIVDYKCAENDVASCDIVKELSALKVNEIRVFINSYGGSVSSGIAIYNALKRHSAKVVTYCDGMACSIASVIFMAGDERVMCNPSFLMIHDAWSCVIGNADELRKQADDLEVINTASVAAYMERINITEEKLRELMKAETWLTEEEALEMGFATRIDEAEESDNPSQSAKKHLFEMIARAISQSAADDVEEPEIPDNGSDDEDDSNGDEVNTEPQDVPDEDDEQKGNDPEPAQRWSGFFNAISRA